jgi:hypothetical protein
MFNVYFYGPLRVLVDAETQTVATVQDRISGENAIFRFSPDYILAAKEFALRAEASLFSEA